MSFFRHLRVLLWKNFILRRRTKYSTLAEILIPTVLILVIVVLRNITVNKDDPFDITTNEMRSGMSFSSMLNMDGFACNPNENQHIAIGPPKYVPDFLSWADSYFITGMDSKITADSLFLPYENINDVNKVISSKDYPNGFPNFVELPEGRKNPSEASTNSSSICAAIFLDEPEDGGYPHTYTISSNLTMFFNLGVRFPERQKSLPDEFEKTTSIFSKSRTSSLQLMMDNFLLMKHFERNYPEAELDPLPLLMNTLIYVPAPSFSSPWQQFVKLSASTIPMILFLAFTYSVGRICSKLTIEKEVGIREALRLAGVYESAFYLSWLIDFFCVFMISALLTTVSCVTCDLVTNVTFGGLVFILVPFALCTMSFSFFVASFFKTAKTSAIAGSVLYFMGFSLSSVINSNSSYNTKLFFSIFPQIGFVQTFSILLKLARSENMSGDFETLYGENRYVDATGFSVLDGVLSMLISVPLYIAVGIYIDQLFSSSSSGKRRHPLFFLGFGRSKSVSPSTTSRSSQVEADGLSANLIANDEGKNLMSVAALRSEDHEHLGDIQPPTAAQRMQISDKNCVQIRNLTKCFHQDQNIIRAVDGLNLDLYSDEMTVLLGHNGAGKSTTISMLTGSVSSTSGEISMPGGFSLPQDLAAVRASLGVCPQHDVLWSNLSVQEHFTLFALLRLPSVAHHCDEKAAIDSALDLMHQVGLENKRLAHASHLSGGMRRKLSVALAFVGAPRVVVLDEPSSGMDPTARQQMWAMLKKLKRGRVCLLTTHYMDEAEALGDRVAVMAAGQLRCVGDSMFLRDRFKCGLRLVVVRAPPRVLKARQESGEEGLIAATRLGLSDDLIKAQDASEGKEGKHKLMDTIQSHIGKDYFEILSDIANNMEIRIDTSKSSSLPALFTEMDARQIELGISTYTVSVASLEEVFLKVAEGENEEVVPAQGDDSRTLSFFSHSKSAKSLVADENREDDNEALISRKDNIKKPLLSNHPAAAQKTEYKSANQDLKAQKRLLIAEEDSSANLVETEQVDLRKATGWELTFLQQSALLEKRWRFFKRDKKSFVCQLMLPLLLIFVGVAVKGELMQPDYRPFSSITSSANVVNAVNSSSAPLQMPILDMSSDKNPANEGFNFHFNALDSSFKNWNSDAGKVLKPFNLVGDSLRFPSPYTLPTLDVTTKDMFPFKATLDSALDKIPAKMRPEDAIIIRDLSVEQAMWMWGFPNVTTLPERRKTEYDVFSTYCVKPKIPNIIPKDKIPPQALDILEMYGSTTYVLLNPNPLHNTVFAINTRTNAIAAQLKLKLPGPIDSKVQLLQLTESVLKTKDVAEGLSVTFFLQLAFVFVPVGIVAYAVREKQSGAKFQQFVSGCSPLAYWLANLTFDYLMYLIPVAIALLLLWAFGVKMFVTGNPGLFTALLLICFGLSSISQANLLSLFFKEYSSGMITTLSLNLILGFIGSLIVILLEAIGEMKKDEGLLNGGKIAATVLRLISPSFSLGRALMLIPKCEISALGVSFSEEGQVLRRCEAHEWNQGGQEVFWLLTMALIFFFTLLSLEVIKDVQFSLREWLINRGWMKSDDAQHSHNASSQTLLEAQSIDSDVLLEKMRISALTAEEKALQPLLIENIHKVYPPPSTSAFCSSGGAKSHHAVKGLSVAVDSGEVFGLLGVNGAGKSTTMKLVCAAEALIGPSGGRADAGSITLKGLSVSLNPRQCRRSLGYCPQYDAHLPILTPQEHLELYIKLRGLRPDNNGKPASEKMSQKAFIEKMTQQKLEQTGLFAQKDNRASSLSGGNRRRLSLAMATIGDPSIVLLDEPSCGLDPIARRALWGVVRQIARLKSSNKGNSAAVVLTTHAMEEADALCSRVGIMVGGQMRCLGSVAHLSNKFASDKIKVVIRLNSLELPSSKRVSSEELFVAWRALGAESGLSALMDVALEKISSNKDQHVDPDTLCAEFQSAMVLALVEKNFCPSTDSFSTMSASELTVEQDRSGFLLTHHVPLKRVTDESSKSEVSTPVSQLFSRLEAVQVMCRDLGKKHAADVVNSLILGGGELIGEAVVQQTSLEDVFHLMATSPSQETL